jgi:hypothetical protein
LLECFRCQYHPIQSTFFLLRPLWNLSGIDSKSFGRLENVVWKALKKFIPKMRGQSQSYSLPSNPYLPPTPSSIGTVAQFGFERIANTP